MRVHLLSYPTKIWMIKEQRRLGITRHELCKCWSSGDLRVLFWNVSHHHRVGFWLIFPLPSFICSSGTGCLNEKQNNSQLKPGYTLHHYLHSALTTGSTDVTPILSFFRIHEDDLWTSSPWEESLNISTINGVTWNLFGLAY